MHTAMIGLLWHKDTVQGWLRAEGPTKDSLVPRLSAIINSKSRGGLLWLDPTIPLYLMWRLNVNFIHITMFHAAVFHCKM